jgi:hypothetical protein
MAPPGFMIRFNPSCVSESLINKKQLGIKVVKKMLVYLFSGIFHISFILFMKNRRGSQDLEIHRGLCDQLKGAVVLKLDGY